MEVFGAPSRTKPKSGALSLASLPTTILQSRRFHCRTIEDFALSVATIASNDPTSLRILDGACHVFFAYDVGFAINVDEVDRLISAEKERESIHHKRRSPAVLQFSPRPLRVRQMAEPVSLGSIQTDGEIDIVLYDFGAVSVAYRIPLTGTLGDLLTLSEGLYENAALLADSRKRVDALLISVEASVSRPKIASFVEDYVVYQIRTWKTDGESELSAADLVDRHRDDIARIMLSERAVLSQQEVSNALACRIAYGVNDDTLIDWHAAFLLGEDSDDVRTLLEFANVELLEMRVLDQNLDAGLEEAQSAASRRIWPKRGRGRAGHTDLWRVAQLQVDNALLFEGVNNTLKMVGDQHLARVYRLAAQRFHLEDWDASILRKLATLDSIYQKLSDHKAHWRTEVLEWIVIVLIAFEIALSLFTNLVSH